jgi:oxygen-independent coproporphyrinogen-3 oxidase
MLGLYLHIPFCKKICDYCDFFTIQGPARLHGEFLDLLFREMELFASKHPQVFSQVETLYLGGGTPSLLSPGQLESLFSRLANLGVPLHALRESTMEFNPESTDKERLEVAARNGVARVSLGLQSFKPELLQAVGRTHDLEQGFAALELLLSSGLRVNADLMFNLPGQSLEQFLEDLEKLSSYPLGHISFYGLKVDPRTQLGRRVEKGLVQIDEDLYGDMYREGVALLQSKGFDRYEVSNFARAGQESLHNLNYWRRGEYLAFGPSAHGYLNRVRFHAPELYPQWRRYVEAGCPESALSKDPVGPEEAVAETIQLSLRTKYGLDLEELRHLGVGLSEKMISRYVDRGFLARCDNRIVLCGDGWLFMDSVVADLYSTVYSNLE